MPNVNEPSFQEVLGQCRSMIQVGSKSFSLAAKTFGRENRDGAFLLYGWCRYCDDEIDRASLEENTSPKLLEDRLQHLKEQTKAAYTDEKLAHPVFIAFRHVVQRYGIPQHYPFELLEGMAMDIRKERYQTIDDLLLYCYRVAGTVGLMMSHIMGVNNEKALEHASALGTAMQLTNIARDVKEDAMMGRVYLPLDWLKQANLSPESVLAMEEPEKIAPVVHRLLITAENFYQSGDRGLKYLSFRCACTISAARHIYSEIGSRIQKLGPRAVDKRVWVPLGRKIWVMARGIFKVLWSLPKRLFQPWRRTTIFLICRHATVAACLWSPGMVFLG